MRRVEQFTPSDRPLLVVCNHSILGATQIQRYAFLLHKQYRRELDRIAATHPELAWYDDWEPNWCGPFSRGLKNDMDACMRGGLVYAHTPLDTVERFLGQREYTLSRAGRNKWYAMRRAFPREAEALRKRVDGLQKAEYVRVLEGVYNAYPEYVKHAATPPA